MSLIPISSERVTQATVVVGAAALGLLLSSEDADIATSAAAGVVGALAGALGLACLEAVSSVAMARVGVLSKWHGDLVERENRLIEKERRL